MAALRVGGAPGDPAGRRSRVVVSRLAREGRRADGGRGGGRRAGPVLGGGQKDGLNPRGIDGPGIALQLRLTLPCDVCAGGGRTTRGNYRPRALGSPARAEVHFSRARQAVMPSTPALSPWPSPAKGRRSTTRGATGSSAARWRSSP